MMHYTIRIEDESGEHMFYGTFWELETMRQEILKIREARPELVVTGLLAKDNKYLTVIK